MRSIFIVIAALSLGACGFQTIDEYDCPPEGTVHTWDSFGRDFITVHCQNCHGQALGDRQRAPVSYDFATVEAVRAHADRIFVRSAAENTTMPPGQDVPPRDERYALAEWLACGAPE